MHYVAAAAELLEPLAAHARREAGWGILVTFIPELFADIDARNVVAKDLIDEMDRTGAIRACADRTGKARACRAFDL